MNASGDGYCTRFVNASSLQCTLKRTAHSSSPQPRPPLRREHVVVLAPRSHFTPSAQDLDRTSCHRFVANQFRLILHAAAFILLSYMRKQLRGTRLEKAQVCTLQRHLLKLGVRVKQTARRVWLHFASNCPVQDLWPVLLARMRASPA